MLIKSTKLERTLWLLRMFIAEIFRVSLVSYMVLFLVNDIFRGFVSTYFNLQIILWIAVGSSAAHLLLKSEDPEDTLGIGVDGWKRHFVIISVGIASALLVYYRIHTIGRISYAISTLSGLLVILFTYLLLKENINDSDRS